MWVRADTEGRLSITQYSLGKKGWKRFKKERLSQSSGSLLAQFVSTKHILVYFPKGKNCQGKSYLYNRTIVKNYF